MDLMKLKITQQDIDDAIDARTAKNFDVCKHCIVAQAAGRRFPGKDITVGLEYVWIGTEAYKMNKAGKNLVWRPSTLFNEVQPTTLQLTRIKGKDA